MKQAITISIIFILAIIAMASPASASWMRALDARPEAVATGSALLAIAFVLRRNVHSSGTR